MKKLITISLVLLSTTIKINAQEFKTAIDYLSYVNNIEEPISKETWKYTKTIAHSKSAKRIENVRKSLIKTIQNAKSTLEKNKKGFNGDLEFHQKVISYLEFSELMISEEYAKIVDMQEIAEQSYDYMEAYILTREKVNERIKQEHNNLIKSQKEFAKKYKVNLVESDDSSKFKKNMEISGEVFKYQSNLYLIFFKCNYTDMLLSQSIKNNDLAAIQQNSNSLQQYAEEGLEKIKLYKPYKGDTVLEIATIKSLNSYKDQTEKYIPQIIDFLTYSSKFEEIKSSLERKSEKDRTKEDVDLYNNMVKEINKKINDYNKLNSENVTSKNKQIGEWNIASEKYISRHVPND